MGITYKSKFVDGWYQQGRAAGEAEGIEKEHARRAGRGQSHGHPSYPGVPGPAPIPAERELITTVSTISTISDHLDQLDSWFDRALTATTAASVFED